MKKIMKTAIALVSAVSMLGTCAVPAFAGELSKEELIRKYAPNGMYEVYANPTEFPTVMADGSAELMHDYIVKLEAEGVSLDEQVELAQEKFFNFPNGIISAYNDYRRCMEKEQLQWFVDAEYENGYWYVLREDGTASIVGADQDWVEENSPTALQIPAEIGGVPVTKIEDNAFANETLFNHDITEITVPDTVEIIGNGAFNYAMKGKDCKMNLPQNVKYIGRLAYYGTMHTIMDEFNVIKLPESLEYVGFRAFDKNYADQSHLQFYRVGDFVLDMPESPVFWEMDPIGISAIDFDEYGEDNVTYSEKVAAIAHSPMPELDPNATEEEKQLYEYRAQIHAKGVERTEALKAKCEAFLAAYDIDKIPLNHYPLLNSSNFNSALLLDNQYNIVTMEDVEEYYARPLAKPAAKAPAQLTGDVNCSGAVDVSDAVLLARFCAEDKTASITDAGLRNADANGDGNVSTEDVTRITEIIARR